MAAWILLFFLAAFPAPDWSQCETCGPHPCGPPGHWFECSPVVFAGLARGAVGSPGGRAEAVEEAKVALHVFDVTNVWKGSPGEPIRVWIKGPRDSGEVEVEGQVRIWVKDPRACGGIEVGRRYLVSAWPRDDGLETERFGRVRRFNEAFWERYWMPEPVYERKGYEASPVTSGDLYELLLDRDLCVRRAAVKALGCLSTYDPQVVSTLRTLLRSDDNMAAAMAARTLGSCETAGEAATSDLYWALSHENEEVRGCAMKALSEVEDWSQLYPHFIAALSDSSATVRHTTLFILCGRTPRVPPGLWREFERKVAHLTHDPDPRVRASARDLWRMIELERSRTND